MIFSKKRSVKSESKGTGSRKPTCMGRKIRRHRIPIEFLEPRTLLSLPSVAINSESIVLSAPGPTGVSGSLNPGNSYRFYQIDGTAGERVQFHSVSTTSTNGNWILFGENGNEVAGQAFGSDFVANLTTTGTYYLELTGNIASEIDYSFQVSDISDQKVTTTGLGIAESGTLSGGASTTYTFTAPAGLSVYFNSLDRSVGPVTATLTDPSNRHATTKPSYLQLLWYGEGTPSAGSPKGSVNLFGAGTTATVALTGNELSISFGANGITSLLTETGVTGTGKPTSNFGDGWYALGIDTTGGSGPVFWEPFFRLFGSATGGTTVTGPYTAAGTDARVVYNAEGQSGPLNNADVDGSGAVNSKDLTYTVAAKGASVGAGLQGSYPAFQLFAEAAVAVPANPILVTQSEVQASLPTAISAWQLAGLDAADVRKLESVSVQVSNLGTTILGLEAGGVITINQTAAGYNWYVSAGSGMSQAFGLASQGGESQARSGGPAANEVDLVTVLEHELGHVLGLPDNANSGDLMDITIGLGVRRAPSRADLAAVFSSSTTLSTVSATAPLPAAMLERPQSHSSNAPVTQATVDAALASMLWPASGSGDDPNPPAIYGALVGLTGRRSSLKITTRRKGHPTAPSLRYPDGALSPRFASKMIAAAIKKYAAR